MSVLVTAFEPFGGQDINPGWEAVKLLPERVAGEDMIKLLLPVIFGECALKAVDAIEKCRPSLVICVGQAGGRFGVTSERVAINLDEARIEDNAGNRPSGVPIVSGGPAAYFSTLPVRAMAREIRNRGIPASVSNTAGTYVCNHLMYSVLHHLSINRPEIRGGFIHVPYTPAQAARLSLPAPCLCAGDIAAGIEAAVRAAILYPVDIESFEGAEH